MVTAATRELWERTAPAPERVISAKDDMFLDHWLPNAERFLDADWKGDGLKPSSILALRYCMLMTGGDDAREEGLRLFRTWRRESRRRYREGFYANPLGEPVRRSPHSKDGDA